MFQNNHEGIIKIKQLPKKLRPFCLTPNIVPLITYRDSKNNIDEILNATCHKRFCLNVFCPFKGFVDLDK